MAHLWELKGARERLRLVKADLMEDGSFDNAVMGCEGVFHTASPVYAARSDPKARPATLHPTLYVCLFPPTISI